MTDSTVIIDALRNSKVLGSLTADVRESIIGDTAVIIGRQFAEMPLESQLRLAFAISKHRAVDHIRKEARRLEHERHVAQRLPAGSEPDPSHEAEERETRARLYEAIVATLSPTEQTLIYRHFYQGESITQVARDLEIPSRTAYSILRHALVILRNTLRTEWVAEQRGAPAVPPAQHDESQARLRKLG